MAIQPGILADEAARRTAISDQSQSLLVEAGAGSGKTAVLAGRIATLLAEGVEPRSIVAVTFTEFAASELFVRVRRYVEEMAHGRIPVELRAALPDALSDRQLSCLATANAAVDEMICTTIHGFCQRLIRPYPVEASIDPGATVMDADQAALAFEHVLDEWLRERLSGEACGLLVELVQEDPKSTIDLVRKILAHLRRYREAGTDVPEEEPGALVDAFRGAANRLREFVYGSPAEEADTTAIAVCFGAMAEELVADPQADDPADLVALLRVQTHPDLLTTTGTFFTYRKKGRWGQAARGVGLSKAEGDRLFETAAALYGACCSMWTALQQAVAARVLAGLVELVRPVVGLYQESKRTKALLDFDDLLPRRAWSAARPRRGASSTRGPLFPCPGRRVPGHGPHPGRDLLAPLRRSTRRWQSIGLDDIPDPSWRPLCRGEIPSKRSSDSAAPRSPRTSGPARRSAGTRRTTSSRSRPTSGREGRFSVT